MTAHVVLKIARQVEGDLVFVNAIKGFTEKAAMHEFIIKNPFPAAEKIQGVDCFVQIAIIEDLEIE
jgi:hypothetical protein